MNYQKIAEYLSGELKAYLQQTPCTGFVIGISGGIDSAVVSTLCAMTGKPTTCVSLPLHQAPDQLTRAQEHMDWLKQRYPNVTCGEIDLTDTFEVLKDSLPQSNRTDLLLANVRSRLRMVALYSYGLLVVGTGNKVEDFGVGFFTKYGDGGVDASPIGDLTKTQVRGLALHLDIIPSIRVAKSVDGLWDDNRSDEDQLQGTYAQFEWAMSICEALNHEQEAISAKLSTLQGEEERILKRYLQLHKNAAHKMCMPPIFVIPGELK